jgi:hypothetical protein
LPWLSFKALIIETAVSSQELSIDRIVNCIIMFTGLGKIDLN